MKPGSTDLTLAQKIGAMLLILGSAMLLIWIELIVECVVPFAVRLMVDLLLIIGIGIAVIFLKLK